MSFRNYISSKIGSWGSSNWRGRTRCGRILMWSRWGGIWSGTPRTCRKLGLNHKSICFVCLQIAYRVGSSLTSNICNFVINSICYFSFYYVSANRLTKCRCWWKPSKFDLFWRNCSSRQCCWWQWIFWFFRNCRWWWTGSFCIYGVNSIAVSFSTTQSSMNKRICIAFCIGNNYFKIIRPLSWFNFVSSYFFIRVCNVPWKKYRWGRNWISLQICWFTWCIIWCCWFWEGQQLNSIISLICYKQ